MRWWLIFAGCAGLAPLDGACVGEKLVGQGRHVHRILTKQGKEVVDLAHALADDPPSLRRLKRDDVLFNVGAGILGAGIAALVSVPIAVEHSDQPQASALPLAVVGVAALVAGSITAAESYRRDRAIVNDYNRSHGCP